MIKQMAAMIVFMTGMIPMACYADYNWTPTDHSRKDYSTGVTRKLGRGLSNTGLGWVEIFKGTQAVSDEHGYWAGLTWGPLYGALNAVKRTGAGVIETVTFPIPGYDGFEPMIDPEYVME